MFFPHSTDKELPFKEFPDIWNYWTALGIVAHVCNPSTGEAEAGGLRVQGQSGLYSETLSQKIPTRQQNKS
jgi:hypothetical protein